MTRSSEQSKTMRTAILTRWVPFPPLGGAAMRNWQNINLLRSFGPVDVFAATRRQFIPAEGVHPDAVDRLWIEPVKDDAGPDQGTSVFSIPIWLRPFFFEGRVIKAFRRFIDQTRPDLIVVEELALAPIALKGLRAHARIPVIYDAHNVESQLWAHMLTKNHRFGVRSRVWLHRITTTERRLAERCHRIWVCSEHDRAAFAAHHGARHAIDVVNNGLSSEFYASASLSEREKAAKGRDFLFLGTYTYQPNEVAARILIEEIMPRMRQRIPGARLVLVGRGVRPWMQEAARQDPLLIVTGEVADVRPFLASAAAMIVPLTIGSGTRLKILEAFASRCPVITTTKGAEGLGVVDETHLLYAEDPETFLYQIERLISDPMLSLSLTNNAYELFVKTFSWDAIGHSVEASITSMGLMPASRGHSASRSESVPQGGGDAAASRPIEPEKQSSTG